MRPQCRHRRRQVHLLHRRVARRRPLARLASLERRQPREKLLVLCTLRPQLGLERNHARPERRQHALAHGEGARRLVRRLVCHHPRPRAASLCRRTRPRPLRAAELVPAELAARRRQSAVRARRRQHRNPLLVAAVADRLVERAESHAARRTPAREDQPGVAAGAKGVALTALVLCAIRHLEADRALEGLRVRLGLRSGGGGEEGAGGEGGGDGGAIILEERRNAGDGGIISRLVVLANPRGGRHPGCGPGSAFRAPGRLRRLRLHVGRLGRRGSLCCTLKYPLAQG
mmetsp:Transcript_39580/g.128077  ORF Transcript_39580/g.128077 Transcript_39580/m.128077 type:complete len:287 (-) Transcript_39580:159-1019(-)